MSKIINNMFVGMYLRTKKVLQNEKGAQTVEWVALAAVVLFLLFAVATAVRGAEGGIGAAITSKIVELIGQVGGGGGN